MPIIGFTINFPKENNFSHGHYVLAVSSKKWKFRIKVYFIQLLWWNISDSHLWQEPLQVLWHLIEISAGDQLFFWLLQTITSHFNHLMMYKPNNGYWVFRHIFIALSCIQRFVIIDEALQTLLHLLCCLQTRQFQAQDIIYHQIPYILSFDLQ